MRIHKETVVRVFRKGFLEGSHLILHVETARTKSIGQNVRKKEKRRRTF